MTTAYQQLVRAAQVSERDASFIMRHVTSCPTCALCASICRVTNCRTLDASIEFMVESLYPEHMVGLGVQREPDPTKGGP